jgi:hypothetical protein
MAEHWTECGRCEQAVREIKRLRTALRRIKSLGLKNVPKYAQEIADEALTTKTGERNVI